ncbi:Uncharacterised protein [Agrobacterium tumefaciens]|nr:Uncharacterised protein [Agrobacterium tumefaciens]
MIPELPPAFNAGFGLKRTVAKARSFLDSNLTSATSKNQDLYEIVRHIKAFIKSSDGKRDMVGLSPSQAPLPLKRVAKLLLALRRCNGSAVHSLFDRRGAHIAGGDLAAPLLDTIVKPKTGMKRGTCRICYAAQMQKNVGTSVVRA